MADADATLDPSTAGLSTTPPDDGSVMSLVDHLGELRSRVVRAVLAVAFTTTIAFIWLATPARNMLIHLLPLSAGQTQATVQVLGPGDAFVIQMKISVVIGIILAMPVLLYQVWSFVSPGLTASERRTARPWVPLALFFFALGVVIAYVILPFALTFLLAFTDNVLVANFAAGPYFDFVTTMFLVFGLIMEFPILLYGLSRVGIVTSTKLRESRRMIILGIAIFAAVATPGGDLVSPIVLGSTMYVLFELTVVAIRRSGK